MEWSEKKEDSASASASSSWVGEGLGGYNNENVKRARLNSTLSALLDDPILADVPKKPSLSDVDTLISFELGSAMRISILKLDSTSFGTFTFLFCIFTNTYSAFILFTIF